MAKDTTITMRIESERKEDWEQLAHNEGFDGISDLIQFAVTQVGNNGATPSDSTSSEDTTVGLPSEIEDRLKRIENKVDDANGSLDVVKREVTSASSMPATSVIFDQLPSEEDRGVWPEAVAGNIGQPTSTVRDLLNRLHDETSLVKRKERADGKILYWKED